jgi:hypothetical protein
LQQALQQQQLFKYIVCGVNSINDTACVTKITGLTQPEKNISTILVDYSFFQCRPGYPAQKLERSLVFSGLFRLFHLSFSGKCLS